MVEGLGIIYITLLFATVCSFIGCFTNYLDYKKWKDQPTATATILNEICGDNSKEYRFMVEYNYQGQSLKGQFCGKRTSDQECPYREGQALEILFNPVTYEIKTKKAFEGTCKGLKGLPIVFVVCAGITLLMTLLLRGAGYHL